MVKYIVCTLFGACMCMVYSILIFFYSELYFVCIFIARPVCGSDRDDCASGLSKCQDTGSGAYDCSCIEGYDGNGKFCVGSY